MGKEKIAGIYKLTSPSGKCYIGQSMDLDHRMSRYKCGDCKKQPQIYRALKKYGFENFIVEYLWTSTNFSDLKKLNNLLNILEVVYISYFDSAKNGYNLKTGGNAGGLHSQETKDKISKANKGRITSEETKRKLSEINKGKTASEETKLKISEAGKHRITSEETKLKISDKVKDYYNKNEKPKMSEETKLKISKANTGHKHSEESRIKISESLKGEKNYLYGKKIPEETKLKMKLSRSKNGGHNKSVDQYDLMGYFIKTWGSITQASLELKISLSQICSVCKRKAKTAGGFIWKYSENQDE